MMYTDILTLYTCVKNRHLVPPGVEFTSDFALAFAFSRLLRRMKVKLPLEIAWSLGYIAFYKFTYPVCVNL